MGNEKSKNSSIIVSRTSILKLFNSTIFYSIINIIWCLKNKLSKGEWV